MIPRTVCEGETMVSYIETIYHSSLRVENCLIACNAKVYTNSEKGYYAAILQYICVMKKLYKHC